jgi:biopolymer transport protein ExbD
MKGEHSEAPRMRPKARRNLPLRANIDASALGAVLLVLLFLFLALPKADLPRHVVELPQVQHPAPMPGAMREDALRVTVERDGHILLDNEILSPQDLPARLRERVKAGAPRKVYIQADAHVRNADVLRVVEAVRAAGIEDVGFLVQHQAAAPSPR